MALRHTTTIFCHDIQVCLYGNLLGTLTYAWRIPEDEQIDATVVSRIFSRLNDQQSTYCTRAIRQDFMDRYRRLPTMVLRNIHRTLLNDSSSAEYSSQSVVDERVAQAILKVDEPDILLDLRRCNGKPNATTFNAFWQELAAFFEKINPAVDEMRHGDTLHMPFTVSIRHLRDMIEQRLHQKFPDSTPAILSTEWIRLQFWPSNAYTDRAI